MLQRLRENLWAFSLQARDSIVYTIGFKSLDEAGEKMSGYEAMLRLGATAARIKVAHAATAEADPAIYKCSTPMRTRKGNRLWPAWPPGWSGYDPGRALSQRLVTGPDDLPMVHAKRRVKTRVFGAHHLSPDTAFPIWSPLKSTDAYRVALLDA
jgi:hypothetical protein